MPELVCVLTAEEIDKKVTLLAQKISKDFQDRRLILIGVLKGAFVFLSDLMRRMTIPVEVDFVQLSSYGDNATSSGNIILKRDVTSELQGKDVLVVEDIIDTGLTMTKIVRHLKSFNPNSIGVCSLIDKRERRKIKCHVDYACHEVGSGFLVGYGLDYSEKYRNLPAIHHLIL